MRNKEVRMIVQGLFEFDPADPIFQDHFPGYPIVPGTLIVNAFLKALEKTSICQGKTLTLSNFRFKSWVIPGKYQYRIFCKPEKTGQVECELNADSSILVRGTIKW